MVEKAVLSSNIWFRSKSNVNELWIPEDSDFIKVRDWQAGKWEGRGGRSQSV